MMRTIDPFRQLERLSESTFSTGLAYDLVRHDDRFELFIDLPGVDPASIDLTVDGRDLTLSAKRHFSVPNSATIVRSGRTHGTYSRTFHLSDRLDTAGLSADYTAGVLSIVLPVAASAKPRKVNVSVGTTPHGEIATASETSPEVEVASTAEALTD